MISNASKRNKPLSSHQLLMKGESDNPRQFAYSKLGKDLHRGRFSHIIAEHPVIVCSFIGIIVVLIILCTTLVHDVHYDERDNLWATYTLLIIACITFLVALTSLMFGPFSLMLISETGDVLFFLKLIITGHSWEEIGRIMNSYLFQRGIWSTNSYFYDGQQCYDLFVLYSQKFTDPVIQTFIEQAKNKVVESISTEWDKTQVPNKSQSSNA